MLVVRNSWNMILCRSASVVATFTSVVVRDLSFWIWLSKFYDRDDVSPLLMKNGIHE